MEEALNELKLWLETKRSRLIDYRIRIGNVVFHIPFDGSKYLLFKCARCGSCCRGQRYLCLLLTYGDMKRLSRYMKYPSIEAFLKRECVLAEVNERDVYPIIGAPPVKASYIGYFLKRFKDENEETITKPHKCRFLTDRNLCSIYDARPMVCRKFPYTVIWDGELLHAYYVVTPWLKCMGYRAKPKIKRSWLSPYVKHLTQSFEETIETVSKGLMVITDVT